MRSSYFILCAIVASCTQHGERASTTVTTSARPVMNDDAAMRLTVTRCERETTCANIGPGRRWADRGACERELFPSASGRLAAETCAAGVDEPKLTKCRADVRATPCGGS